MRTHLVTFALFAVTALPGAADAQFPDYRFQAEASVGGLMPGYNTIFDQGDVEGTTRKVETLRSPAIAGRFLILWPRGLYSGISFSLAPEIPLVQKTIGTHVGVAQRLRLSVAMGGKTPKIPGTPVRFRGGFDIGFAQYTFVEDPGISIPIETGTNFLAAVSMGWDVELAPPMSLVTDVVMSFEDGQTESLASFLMHLGLAVRFPEIQR
jgi:hypothetical protein